MALRIEVNAHFDNGQAAAGEAGGIVLEVDLLHGGFGRTVEFEFEEVEALGSLQHHIHATCGGAHFHIGKIARHKREYDVENLLVVAFGVGVVAVRDGAEEFLEDGESTIDILLDQALGHVSGSIVDDKCVRSDVGGNKTTC